MGEMSGGSSQTQTTQPYIMSGPTQQAAFEAAQAQIGAAQIAAQAVTQNTTSAINALMGEYSTALQYANPAINTGNQASAQMNYMLGLPAVAPGPAPIAPTMGTPTAPTQEQINEFIMQNSTPVGGSRGQYSYNPNGQANYQYLGPGAINNIQGFTQSVPGDPASGGAPGDYGTLIGLEQQGNIINAATQALEQQQQPQLQQQYNQALQTYNQQKNQWNTENDLYNKYNAMGIATPSDINTIVSNLPGFQFNQQQGINSIQNAASASGLLNSGPLLQQLDQFGQNLSETYYQNYMSNLAGLSGLGQQSTGQAVQGAQNLGSNIAGAYGNQGNAQANAALAAGQAMASSFLTPVDNQKVSMTPYTTSSSTQTSGGASGALGTIGQGVGILGGLFGSGGLFSSRELKETINTPKTEEILDRVKELQIDRWKYKGIDEEHIGPYAEQFKELFHVGNGQTINLIDMFGVILGSIKELNTKIAKLQEASNDRH